MKKKKIFNYVAWDDNKKLRKKFHSKITLNLKEKLKSVDYIILSPGISLKKTKFKKDLIKFKKKIITDIDLLYLFNNKFKSIVVTGSNGKSTTCKIINHLLKKNKLNSQLGGNIGTPVLNLKIKKSTILIIEASSFQLSHSKFIHPDYAILLNITNDHLDWHGSMQDYKISKFKIFNLQKKNNIALINKKLENTFKKNKYLSKLKPLQVNGYKKIKSKINNSYLNSSLNNENMNFVFTISRLFKISDKVFIKSMNTFVGLPHRYEIFLRTKNITFINDSKATSFESTKFALRDNKNIFWIVGGQPKLRDKFNLNGLKDNIIKSYIIGKNTNFFKNQLKNKIKFKIAKNIKRALILIFKDIKQINNEIITVLLSPSSASFDQYQNFSSRGDEFKRLVKLYANKKF